MEQTEQDFREIERERDLPPDEPAGGSSDDLPATCVVCGEPVDVDGYLDVDGYPHHLDCLPKGER